MCTEALQGCRVDVPDHQVAIAIHHAGGCAFDHGEGDRVEREATSFGSRPEPWVRAEAEVWLLVLLIAAGDLHPQGSMLECRCVVDR